MTNENNNQWNEKDYNESEVEESELYDDDEVADEDEIVDAEEESEEYDDFDDDDTTDKNTKDTKHSNKGLLVLILAIVIILAIIFVFLVLKLVQNRIQKSDELKAADNSSVELVADSKSNKDISEDAFFSEKDTGMTSDMLKVDFNENNGSAVVSDETTDNTAVVQDIKNPDETSSIDVADAKDKDKNELMLDFTDDNKTENPNESIMVAWNGVLGRNPFKPPVVRAVKDDKYEKYGNVQFEIMEPPTKLVPDERLTKLLKTQISGILYDAENPSAIVKLDGKDQFVKIGDTIGGYTIKNITKNKVEISYNNNTYVASVGELFTPDDGSLDPAVSNLTSKFAGRYKEENVEE